MQIIWPFANYQCFRVKFKYIFNQHINLVQRRKINHIGSFRSNDNPKWMDVFLHTRHWTDTCPKLTTNKSRSQRQACFRRFEFSATYSRASRQSVISLLKESTAVSWRAGERKHRRVLLTHTLRLSHTPALYSREFSVQNVVMSVFYNPDRSECDSTCTGTHIDVWLLANNWVNSTWQRSLMCLVLIKCKETTFSLLISFLKKWFILSI